MKSVLSFKAPFLFAALISYQTMPAQLLVNQGQAIVVKDISLFVNGGVENLGTITNNGSIHVSGDWTNSSKYKPGNGTLVLTSNASQQIKHRGDSIYLLELKGTGDKVLDENISIIQEVKFTVPVLLKTSATGAVIILNGATITGHGSNAYVDGLLYHTGTGKKEYPVGKNEKYLPVILENIVSNNSNPVTGIEIVEPNNGARPGHELSSVSQLRAVHLISKGGEKISTPITFTVADDEVVTNDEALVVAESNAQGALYRSLGKSTINSTQGIRSLTSNVVITGSFFAVASLNEQLDANSVYIPSGFSPKASNPEDQAIRIYGDLLSSDDFEFRVFSKWGSVVFESRSLQEMKSTGWRGVDKSSDEELSGSYTYSLKGKFFNGKVVTKSGSITLIK